MESDLVTTIVFLCILYVIVFMIIGYLVSISKTFVNS